MTSQAIALRLPGEMVRWMMCHAQHVFPGHMTDIGPRLPRGPTPGGSTFWRRFVRNASPNTQRFVQIVRRWRTFCGCDAGSAASQGPAVQRRMPSHGFSTCKCAAQTTHCPKALRPGSPPLPVVLRGIQRLVRGGGWTGAGADGKRGRAHRGWSLRARFPLKREGSLCGPYQRLPNSGRVQS